MYHFDIYLHIYFCIYSFSFLSLLFCLILHWSSISLSHFLSRLWSVPLATVKAHLDLQLVSHPIVFSRDSQMGRLRIRNRSDRSSISHLYERFPLLLSIRRDRNEVIRCTLRSCLSSQSVKYNRINFFFLHVLSLLSLYREIRSERAAREICVVIQNMFLTTKIGHALVSSFLVWFPLFSSSFVFSLFDWLP